MLRKLLKYDFRAVLKLWCIGALAVLVLNVCDGFCAQIEYSGRNLHGMIYMVIGLVQMIAGTCGVAFYIMNILILSLRFYKNFFTDEGYLTFTLPVPKRTVLNSKLIVSLVMMVATFWLCVFGSYLSDLIARAGIPEKTNYYYNSYSGYTTTIGADIFMLIREAFSGAYKADQLLWAILYAAEIALVLVLSTLFSILFMSNCITFGSVIAKRGKVIAGIGIYFGANSVMTTVTAIMLVFALPTLVTWFEDSIIRDGDDMIIIALLLLLWAAFRALMCSLLYVLQYRLLDRKLNLP